MYYQMFSITDQTGVFVYLRLTLLLSLRLPQLLGLSDGGARFNHDLLGALGVGRVGRLGQIQELVPSLAPEPDPVQMLPHGGRREAGLYLNMTDDRAAETGREEEHRDAMHRTINKKPTRVSTVLTSVFSADNQSRTAIKV